MPQWGASVRTLHRLDPPPHWITLKKDLSEAALYPDTARTPPGPISTDWGVLFWAKSLFVSSISKWHFTVCFRGMDYILYDAQGTLKGCWEKKSHYSPCHMTVLPQQRKPGSITENHYRQSRGKQLAAYTLKWYVPCLAVQTVIIALALVHSGCGFHYH